MELVVVGSSSAGNAMLLIADEGALLIDAGFSMKEVRRRLSAAGHGLDRIRGVLVTHEHSDHASGVGRFARVAGLKVATNAATAAAVHGKFGVDGLHAIGPGATESLGAFAVRPIPVPHDSADCTGFEIAVDGKRVVYATDMGGVPTELIKAGALADLVVIESNHDAAMLWAGSYPKPLKVRITGGRGHLSNEQAGEAAAKMAGGPLKRVVLAHLSVENNQPEKARAAVEGALRRTGGLAGFDVRVDAAPTDGPWRVLVP